MTWLVFVTETECAYCAVRTESFNVMQVKRCIEIVNLQDDVFLQMAERERWTKKDVN